jgi:spermidine/putrescine transport system ATP-binding protein
LRLENVTKSFAEFTAVDDLSLVVPRGSFFALLGPSGCGKTTTLRMVAGLEQPTSGRLLIGDTDLTGSRSYERPVNTVFQSYALFPHLTIRDNVAFGPKRRGQADAAALAEDALKLVQMDHLAARKPAQLSGGQQQRVALARAIVNRPEVLLLDEPLGALDLKLRRQMQIELKRIQTEVGLTFVHVTHDQEEAMTMADTVAVMNQGKHRTDGPPELQMYDLPRTAFVANFVGQSNLGPVTGTSTVTAATSAPRSTASGQGRCGSLGRAPIRWKATLALRVCARRRCASTTPSLTSGVGLTDVKGTVGSSTCRSPVSPPSTSCSCRVRHGGSCYEQNLDVEPDRHSTGRRPCGCPGMPVTRSSSPVDEGSSASAGLGGDLR